MAQAIPRQLRRRAVGAAIALALVTTCGSVGYYLLTWGRSSFVDCLYMTVITITTVGFGEVIDLSSSPAGRVFTMLLALSGLGTATYLLSTMTAFLIEGDLTERFRRRAMEKKAAAASNHYIVCGMGRLGLNIVQELRSTQRPCVVVDRDPENFKTLAEAAPEVICVEADATDSDGLLAAGIKNAAGLFAATDDDNENLVIALTAKQLSPGAKVVVRCGEMKNASKMKVAGADAVICPSSIGAMRMASEMVRPTVVSFLDTMLRDREKNYRVEEVRAGIPGLRICDLPWPQFPNTLLLAVRGPEGWVYRPPRDYVLCEESRLIVMTTPEERSGLERALQEEAR